MATSAIDIQDATRGRGLYARIGAFLTEHRLSPEPAHYAFAYEVMANGDGAIARRVRDLTDGGFRLSGSDIEALGGTVVIGRPIDADDTSDEQGEVAELVGRALTQIDGFNDTIRAVHAETNDFGRDLKASADAMQRAGPDIGVAEITRLTGAMLERVRLAESRLETARRESDELRSALAEAHGHARTDVLTELPNRRAFDEILAAIVPGSRNTVAICDIDHFKRINDSFGHAVGDRVLKAIAQTLAAEVGCRVARYGGEEFALLFEHDDVSAAEAAIARVRGIVGSRRLRVRESGAFIGEMSFSAGIAVMREGEHRAAAMARADAALYRAKNAGRAQTRIAP